MKQIENKATNIPTEEGTCDYAKLIEIALKSPIINSMGQAVMFGYEDIENRLAIGQAIKNVNGVIQVEDAHFKYLKTMINATKWRVVHEDLLKFRDDINSIK